MSYQSKELYRVFIKSQARLDIKKISNISARAFIATKTSLDRSAENNWYAQMLRLVLLVITFAAVALHDAAGQDTNAPLGC